ncbi:ATP-dependent zinc metalloprotease FtsH [Alicycliphilus denitrificans]|uniref:ATP-dependent zinc metalloprotease FtsH n=2 Tax=Alicycliphilus denitrificans TaxID=179636 RepID=F4G7K8_ALIDK|nr:ATP-dependent zinc metalloprotease FtsH [Alicycliphilus denitrificans]AEB86605.1 ATP-dependent metalloprotease FtsH [Alicycliphilus denitrificans K601]QKD45704.1 ATP-dependent zinc metalloprotease FtsH [Alicycliphilus denitrificans]
MPPPQPPRPGPPPGSPQPPWQWNPNRLWLVILALTALFWLRDLWVTSNQVQPIPYSEFLQHLKAGRLQSISISSQFIEGQLKTALPDGRTRIVTTRVDPALAAELAGYDVRFEGVVENKLLSGLLSWVIPGLMLLAAWSFIGRRIAAQGGMGGLLAVGKSRAKLHSETDVKVSFDDVAGVDEAKAELRESVEFLRNPKDYGRLGAHMPKGILLVGPPGTGKTLLARAMAGEAGVPFFSITGSEFVEMFVGVGAARVRDLFEQARASAPCIIFIDELDALGRARGVGPLSGGHDEKEQTLNQLLAEMDGFDTSAGVVILAATNRPEILDPALLRAGRFDRQVLVDRPDRKGRADVLRVHLRKVRLGGDVDPDAVAALTPGFAGADLANLVNEAALLATRRGADAVAMADFTAAVERIVAGLERHQRVLGDKERRTVAVHEMGHALVAMALPGTDPVHKISIIPRGIGALGYTLQRPSEDRYLASEGELRNRLAVLMAGRAAEALVMGEVSTGAADDLVKATDIARDMVARYGMSPEVGQVVYERQQPRFLDLPDGMALERGLSDDTSRRIDMAVRALVDEAFARASAVLAERRALLQEGADKLLAQETLTEADLLPLAEAARRGSAA